MELPTGRKWGLRTRLLVAGAGFAVWVVVLLIGSQIMDSITDWEDRGKPKPITALNLPRDQGAVLGERLDGTVKEDPNAVTTTPEPAKPLPKLEPKKPDPQPQKTTPRPATPAPAPSAPAQPQPQPQPTPRPTPAPPKPKPVARITVPDLVGRTLPNARRQLAGLRAVSANCPVATCLVLRQNVSPGARLQRGNRVSLTLGARVPGLFRKSVSQARAILGQSGLNLAATPRGCGGVNSICRVRNWSPSGQLVALRSRVSIDVDIMVPDVRGQTTAQARTILQAAGLNSTVRRDGDTCSDQTCIVRRSYPRTSQWVAQDVAVTLILR